MFGTGIKGGGFFNAERPRPTRHRPASPIVRRDFSNHVVDAPSCVRPDAWSECFVPACPGHVWKQIYRSDVALLGGGDHVAGDGAIHRQDTIALRRRCEYEVSALARQEKNAAIDTVVVFAGDSLG
jgi:hypothetical protein